MLRSKPVQDHTSAAEPIASVQLEPIGRVRSPYTERFGTPRQPGVTEQVLGDTLQPAQIVLREDLAVAAADLAGFDRIWVVAWLHLNRGWSATVVPPRGPKVRRGVLSTRAPHRPNPIGLSALRLVGVEGNILHVLGIDLLDGTPVLDVKPYVPYTDAFPDSGVGWLTGLIPTAPDRFEPKVDPKGGAR